MKIRFIYELSTFQNQSNGSSVPKLFIVVAKIGSASSTASIGAAHH